MSQHDDLVRVEHIVAAAQDALRWTRGSDWPSFEADAQLQAAVTYRIQTIGEAAAHLSAGFRAAHPQVAWRRIIGMRNILVHGYAEVDPIILWQAVREDLPPLLEYMRALLPPEPPP